MQAGIPLSEGLDIMRMHARRTAESRVLERISGDVLSGHALSKSFGRFPKVFSEFSVAVVRVGEQSGTLSLNLLYLAEELKKKQHLRRKILSASIYPALITVATGAITIFLVLYLFPKIMPVFLSLDAELPRTTKFVMAATIFLQEWGLYTLFAVVGVSLLFVGILKRSVFLRRAFETLLLALPIVGSLLRSYYLAGITRTLHLLIKSGMPLPEVLRVTAGSTKNLVYKGEIIRMERAVLKGERVSAYLAGRPRYFPHIAAQMVAVGERSGSLEETLCYLSELYEHEVDEWAKNLSTLVEPILMLLMGLLVGLIAISIITPIYGITSTLHT